MRTARTLLVAAASWVTLFAGCQVMNSAPWWHPAANHSASRSVKSKAKKDEDSSLLSSWFGPKEPPPPKTMKEWMDLEPIRP